MVNIPFFELLTLELFFRAKLGLGLLSGDYSALTEDKDQKGISPQMFMNLIGKSHPEFGTKRQQDAQEFFLFFLDVVTVSS